MTGVQTCALPISHASAPGTFTWVRLRHDDIPPLVGRERVRQVGEHVDVAIAPRSPGDDNPGLVRAVDGRERGVDRNDLPLQRFRRSVDARAVKPSLLPPPIAAL